MPGSVRVFAPAKVNLCLHVGPLRTDGLHPVWSLAAFAADAGDWITATQADDLVLQVCGAFAAGLAQEPDNLALRAARLLAGESGKPCRAALTLEKQLPIAAGLGGGSSDAAATLKALNTLWSLGADEADLARLGARLGADVAACVGASACVMTGVGEIVAPLALPALDAVLVNPGAPAPTGAVYAAFDAMSAPAALDARATPAWATPAAAVEGLAALRNDLFAPACAVAPAIADAAAALARFDAVKLVRLSGSGATLVAYVSDANAAARLSARIAADYPSWWVARTRLG